MKANGRQYGTRTCVHQMIYHQGRTRLARLKNCLRLDRLKKKKLKIKKEWKRRATMKRNMTPNNQLPHRLSSTSRI